MANVNKKILILGAGKTGQAIKSFLSHLGRPSLLIDDNRNLSEIDLQQASALGPGIAVISPGISPKTTWVVELQNNGWAVVSELDFFSEYWTTERIIAVTGSLGKSTTTSLIGEAISAVDPDAFIGGNLGVPLGTYFLNKQKTGRTSKWVVLELSSFQLELTSKFRPAASLITYLAPNHLDRHGSQQAYYDCKWRLVEMTDGPCFLNQDSADLIAFAATKPATQDKLKWVAPTLHPEAKLLGNHNQSNLSLASAIINYFKLGPKAHQRIYDFPGLPHRFENLGTHAGIKFINDSKATTLESVLAAATSLAQMPQINRKILLMGGKDKGLDWSPLRNSLPAGLEVFTFGQLGPTLHALVNSKAPAFLSLKDAFTFLKNWPLTKGDCVLLSPGGTSLDEFRSFEERGDLFRNFAMAYDST